MLTKEKGVNLILDMVAGDYVEKNLKCLSEDAEGFIAGAKFDQKFYFLLRKL